MISWEYHEETELPPGVTVSEWYAVNGEIRYVVPVRDGVWPDAMIVTYPRFANPRPRVRAAYRRHGFCR